MVWIFSSNSWKNVKLFFFTTVCFPSIPKSLTLSLFYFLSCNFHVFNPFFFLCLGTFLTFFSQASDNHLNLVDSLSLSPFLSQCTCTYVCKLFHFLHIFYAVYSCSLQVHEDILMWIICVGVCSPCLCGPVLTETEARVRPDHAVSPTHPTLPCLTGSVGMCHPIS